MGMLLLAPSLPFGVTVFFLISTGFFAGAQAITFAVAVEQHGQFCRATAVAFVNFFVMLGGFLLQPAFGAILDSTTANSTYTAGEYQKSSYPFTCFNYHWNYPELLGLKETTEK